MDTGEARWELRTGEGAAVSAGAEQLAGVDMDEVFGPRFAEAVATVAAREHPSEAQARPASHDPLTMEPDVLREYIARVLHDAATGKICPDPADPTPYARMAEAVRAEVVSPLVALVTGHLARLSEPIGALLADRDVEMGDLTVAIGDAQDAWHFGDPEDETDLNRATAVALLARYEIRRRRDV